MRLSGWMGRSLRRDDRCSQVRTSLNDLRGDEVTGEAKRAVGPVRRLSWGRT